MDSKIFKNKCDHYTIKKTLELYFNKEVSQLTFFPDDTFTILEILEICSRYKSMDVSINYIVNKPIMEPFR